MVGRGCVVVGGAAESGEGRWAVICGRRKSRWNGGCVMGMAHEAEVIRVCSGDAVSELAAFGAWS